MKKILMIVIAVLLMIVLYGSFHYRNIYVITHHANGEEWFVGKYRANYFDTISVGTWTEYFQNGNKRAFINYNNKGQEHGKKSLKYENGKTRYIIEYVEGKREGLYSSYFENGEYKCIGQFAGDKKVGKWTYFTEDGDTLEVVQY